MIEELLDYLEANNFGVVNTDLFINELPVDVPNCISLNRSISPETNLTLDIFEQTIDFWSRHTSSKSGYDKLKAIDDFFNRKHHYSFGDYYVYLSHSLSTIEDNDRDIERRKLDKLSINFIYRVDTLVS